MFYKWLGIAGFAVFSVLYASPASATTCNIPNTFVNGTPAVASQVNTNFSSLQSCGNNIDNTNIGTSGIYASQIKPTNGTQATFGGSSTYTMPSGLTTGGTVTSNSSGNVSFSANQNDGTSVLDFNANSGANLTSIGQNQGGSYPALSVAKLSSGGTYQSTLLGMDESGNTTISGTVTSQNTITSNSAGNTAFAANQNNGTNVLTFNANSGANLTAIGQNQGGSYPALTVAKLSSGGSYQSTLLGMDESGNTTILGGITTNGNSQFNGNVGSSGNFLTYSGSITGGNLAQYISGTSFQVPYDAQSTGGSTFTHLEHGTILIGSMTSGSCQTGSANFGKTYGITPTVVISIDGASAQNLTASTSLTNTTTFQFGVCNNSGSGVSSIALHWIALGE